MLRPLDDRVVLREIESPDKTEGGIILPGEAKDKTNKAEVVAVGPGKWQLGQQVPVDVQVGDTVVFNHYAGQMVDGLRIVRESDILAIVNDD